MAEQPQNLDRSVVGPTEVNVMGRAAYKATVERNAEYRVEEIRHSPTVVPPNERIQKERLSLNRVLFIVSFSFVTLAFIVMSASSRSVLGGTFLFVGAVFAFAYAAREVRGFSTHRRL